MPSSIKGHVDYSGCKPRAAKADDAAHVRKRIAKPVDQRGDPWSKAERNLLSKLIQDGEPMHKIVAMWTTRKPSAVKVMARRLGWNGGMKR